MSPLERVALAVRIAGFGKFASAYVREYGETPPEEWDMHGCFNHLGHKLATQFAAEEEVLTGARAASCFGDVKVASSIDFTTEFHAVNRLAYGLDKTASTGAEEELSERRVALWGAMKEAAERSPNTLSGLAKIALRVWSETTRTGEKTASTREEREAFALAFAANYLVDEKVATAYNKGEIDRADVVKLAHLSAECAMEDLSGVLKIAVDPRLIGAGVGAAGGAIAGAVSDKDNRWRGAGMGAAMGIPVGALGGQVAKELMAHGAPDPEKVRRGQEAFEKMKAYAGKMGNPGGPSNGGLSSLLDEHRNSIISSFGEGRRLMPTPIIEGMAPNDYEQLVKLDKAYGGGVFGKTAMPVDPSQMAAPPGAAPPGATPPGAAPPGGPPQLPLNADAQRKGNAGFQQLVSYGQAIGNGFPELVEQHKDAIIQHFAEGNKHMPPQITATLGPGVIDQVLELKKRFNAAIL